LFWGKSSMNDKMLKTILDDLEFFEVIPHCEESEGDLRRNSAILRRLLVEGDLGQAWRFLGFKKEPILEGPDLVETLAPYNLSQIDSAVISGPSNRGVFTMSSRGIKKNQDDFVRPKYSNMYMSKYLESPVFYFNKVWITRREVIKYIANYCGGVHLASGSESKEYAQKVKAIEGHFGAYQKDMIFFELSSIQQSLIRSDDIIALKTKIRERLPIDPEA